MGDLTSVQVFIKDRLKILELVELLEKDMGGFVSQRVAVMTAVNKLLKEERKNEYKRN